MAAPLAESDSESLLAAMKRLEERIARIEEHLGLAVAGSPAVPPPAVNAEEAEENLEVQLGQNWFAKVGIAVLTLGVIFLLTFPYEALPPVVPSLIGYVLVGVLIAASRGLHRTYQQVSRYLLGAALLLLYFTTLRLAHFSPEVAIGNPAVEVALLLLVVAINLGVAERRKSPYLAGLNLALGYFTALAATEPYTVFCIIAAMSGASVVFRMRNGWHGLTLLGAVLAYPVHLLWALNDPVFGNAMHLVTAPEINLAFILLTAVILGAGSMERGGQDETVEVIGAALNGGGAYSLMFFLTLAAFPAHFVLWHLLCSLTLLGLSIAYWIRRQSKYITFVYSMLGYTALSAAIVAQFPMPEFFVWLCWQSILVLSMAVWFRSRFIVVGNFVIYLIVFIAYLVTAGTVSAVSISFGIVALLSARVMKWQQDRLELKTEMMRNAYLLSALFVIPYALYHTVPPGFVSLSWLCAAATYYLVSRLLHNNRKYRWMALLTTVLTILYVVFVDLVGVNPVFRVITFLVLGSALLVISMMYSRRKARSVATKPSSDTAGDGA